ncbi:MAG: hypothetical protein LBK23_06135 [Oscillospiraceae bacterium]|jgi:hypothetical protein|nr:hypothetical protein [Oscillospiraceae bacterium]
MGRIKYVLNFKKPSRIIVVAAIALAAALVVVFAANGADGDKKARGKLFVVGEEVLVGSFDAPGIDYTEIKIEALSNTAKDSAAAEFHISIRSADTDEEVAAGYCNFNQPLIFTVSGYVDAKIYATAVAMDEAFDGYAEFEISGPEMTE